MHYQFQAKRSNGDRVNSRIEARGLKEARSLLESRGLSHIELTEIDGPPPRATNAIDSATGVFFRLILFLAIGGGVVAGIGSLIYNNMGQDSLNEELTAEETDSTSSAGEPARSSTLSAPQHEEFDTDRVRRALSQEVTISKTIAVRRQRQSPVNRDLVCWLDLTSVSFRSGTEIGYEYDVVISYRREAGIMNDGQLREMQDSSPCKIVLHVSNDYRVADNFSIQGEMAITEHADYIANVIEQLGR